MELFVQEDPLPRLVTAGEATDLVGEVPATLVDHPVRTVERHLLVAAGRCTVQAQVLGNKNKQNNGKR